MTTSNDWWDETLKERHADGRADADKGVYEPPYPGSDDPTDDYENGAYQDGFKQRRRELGDAFKWK